MHLTLGIPLLDDVRTKMWGETEAKGKKQNAYLTLKLTQPLNNFRKMDGWMNGGLYSNQISKQKHTEIAVICETIQG